MGTKQVKANVPEEIHRRLRIALAEDQETFAGWLAQQIVSYLQPKGHLKLPQDSALITSYLRSMKGADEAAYPPAKGPKAKRKGKGG